MIARIKFYLSILGRGFLTALIAVVSTAVITLTLVATSWLVGIGVTEVMSPMSTTPAFFDAVFAGGLVLALVCLVISGCIALIHGSFIAAKAKVKASSK